MRFVISLFLILTLAAAAQAQVEPPVKPPVPVPPKRITQPTVAAKAGELIVLPGGTAKAVVWDFDERQFDAKHSKQAGNDLILTTGVNGAYRIVFVGDGVKEIVMVTVTGGLPSPITPPDPPPPNDPIEKVAQSVASLQKAFDAFVVMQTKFNAAQDARLTALEQIKPNPPPVDAFQAAVQAAYVADGKPAAAVASLAAIYRQSGPTVQNTTMTKSSDVLNAMHIAATSLIANQLPTVRRVLADELNANLGKADKTLDAPTRALISAQFLRMQHALEGVK